MGMMKQMCVCLDFLKTCGYMNNEHLLVGSHGVDGLSRC